MATLRKSLRAYLLTHDSIKSLVAERIFPSVLPQGEKRAAVVLRQISGIATHTLTDRTALAHQRVQVFCYSPNDKDEADQIALAIQTCGICSLREEIDGITFLGAEIESVNEDEDEPPTDGNQEHRYITTFDLMIHYWEAN